MLKFTDIFPQGRFCNVLMQNIGLSVIGKKFNLKCQYDWDSKNGYSFTIDSCLKDNFVFYDKGRVFDGQYQYYCDDSLETLLENNEVSYPIEYEGFLQKKCLLYGESEFLDSCIIKNDIEYKNQVFVHVRLGDQLMNTAGYSYYEKVLDSINFKDGLISSDSPDNEIIQNLINRYNLILYNNNNFQEVISIASKFDHRIVTGGSSGWIIGYLGNNDNVYYVKNEYPHHIKYWPIEMFDNPKWKGY